MQDDSASAEELVALRAAVLRDHDQFVRMGPKRHSVRMARGLKRLHLSWLLIPWYLVLAARFFLLPGSWRRLATDEEQAVHLYRRLSGKDPRVARAEVGRIVLQLGALDERLCLDDGRPGAPGGADPDEVEAAAGAMVGYYLAGRRTDDELLSEVEAAWASYEELTEQQLERAMGGKRVGRRGAGLMADERIQAAADRYRTAWRRWFDRRVEDGSATGPGAR